MKGTALLLVSLLLLTSLLCSRSALAGPTPPRTSFTYQGRLTAHGAPATGDYDFQFTLRDAEAGGQPIGIPITKAPVTVNQGLFVVSLDFGEAAFDGGNRWLEVAVRTNGSPELYEVLSPAQPLTATPYSLYALAAQTFVGPVEDSQLSPNIVRLTSSQVSFAGSVAVGNNTDPAPPPGAIRWTGTDFEGYNGLSWVSLTARFSRAHASTRDGHGMDRTRHLPIGQPGE